MSWRWTARKWLVSAFVLFHLTATALWITPFCAIKQRLGIPLTYYMFPTGTWQGWMMFAPNPPATINTLEAVAVDAQGIRHEFLFPRIADYSFWETLPRFRHPKFIANLLLDDNAVSRQFAARHVARKLDLPAKAYPLNVQLVYMVKKIPPPFSPPDTAVEPPESVMHTSFWFRQPSEVRP